MPPRIEQSKDPQKYKITCDDCGSEMELSSINDVLYWLPEHLAPGHNESSNQEERVASAGLDGDKD